MKKVISIVLNNFKNDSRVLKENLSLQRAGYDVKVIALHDGSLLKEFDDIQGITIHRVRLKSKNWSKNKIIQLFKYVEYIYKVIKQYGYYCDIVHCNDLNTLPIGVIVKKIYNKDVKIVYDAHEHETERIQVKGFIKRLTKILEKKCIKYADRVITVSDSIADEYVKLYKINKPVVVLNAPPFIEFTNKTDIFREVFNITKEQMIFLYQGMLNRGRGIEIILDAFKKLSNKTHVLNGKVVIVFMGLGELEDFIQKTAQKYDNIYFHPAVLPNVILNYTNSADVGISMIEDISLSYKYCLPNKLFEYVMAELPVIVSNLYEMKKLVIQNKIGCMSKENTSESLISAINEIINMNFQELKNNTKNFKTIYNWEEQEKILLNVYKKLE